MKLFLTALLVFLQAAVCQAQILALDWQGDNLPQKHMQRINKVLLKEIDFYGPLGLKDTVSLKIVVFKDHDKGNEYLRKFIPDSPTAYGTRYSGVFLSKYKTAVILSTENPDAACTTICHEISHFLLHSLLHGFIPSCLDEGLATYFGHLKARKDGTFLVDLDGSYSGSVKTLLQLGEFNLDQYLEMGHSEFKELERHEAGLPYFVSSTITSVLFERLGDSGVQEMLRQIKGGLKFQSAIDELYPDGRNGLLKDITAYVERQ